MKRGSKTLPTAYSLLKSQCARQSERLLTASLYYHPQSVASWRALKVYYDRGASGQAPFPDPWRDYRSALDGYERALRGLSYRDLPLPSAPFSFYGLPAQSLPITQIET